jgi:hypothetical protein
VDIPEYENTILTRDEIRVMFEKRLLNDVGCVLVEREAIPAPWPSYNEMTTLKQGRTKDRVVADVVNTAGLMGKPLADVLAFERAHARAGLVAGAAPGGGVEAGRVRG